MLPDSGHFRQVRRASYNDLLTAEL
jgi:hypothetical protein